MLTCWCQTNINVSLRHFFTVLYPRGKNGTLLIELRSLIFWLISPTKNKDLS